jgi:polygalacturonase
MHFPDQFRKRRLHSASTICSFALAVACGSSTTAGPSGGAAGSGAVSTAGPGSEPSGGSAGAPSNGGSAQAGGESGGATGTAGVAGASGAGASTTGGAAGASAGGTVGGAAGANAKGGAAGTSGAAGAGGAASTDPCGPTNSHVVPLPVIGSATFSILDYGAATSASDNSQAIQKAIAAAAVAGGTVQIPTGTFLSGPINLQSGVRLDLAAGSTLKMLAMASWPGTTPLLSASNLHDIEVSGSGTIEGQGQAWWNALTATPDLKRPQEIVFTGSTRVRITGIKLQNPPEEHIWVKQDTDVTVQGITISTLAVAGQHIPNNTDGVDINANGVFFCGNDIACGDDNVVMAGQNVYVAHSQFGVGHGCSIGSITENGVSTVTVDDITMNGTTSGIRLKSARDRGGLVQNLTYSNITMTNVQNPVWIDSYYPTDPTDPTLDPAQAVTATTPIWKNITLQNVTVTGSTNAGKLFGLPEEQISNVTFDNVQIQAKTGMDIFHATGIVFENGSTVQATTGSAVIVYDANVTGITTHTYP